MNKLYLAPMEDVTDPAFRMLCKRYGADRVYTEFVNADALVRDVASTTRKLTIHQAERPVAIQIYGRTPESMAEAARIVEQAQPDFIDINFGCPVKKVAGKGAGAGLLRDVPRMLEIARAVVNAVHTPVTAKTRLGWDEADLHPRVNPLNLPKSYSVSGLTASAVFQQSGLTGEADHKSVFITDLSLALQDCGIQELAIHGRTRSQMYRGEADWTLIGEVKNNPRMHIPVIGNGDVCTPERAKECFDLYGVDAVMVGRATFGNPWLFAEIKEYLDGPSLLQSEGRSYSEAVLQRSGLSAAPPRSMEEKVNVLKEHVLSSIQWCGGDERKGIVHSRRHFAASPVFKGLPDFRQTRIALLRAETVEEVFAIMDSIIAQWGNNETQCPNGK
ncbi:MAG: tRNA-dihydrouridine synthase family protein [Paludibacteraceae bacterium]|nr:tRNA-dihydrouridine synthase family protein [Paludibacteraceae bacterium]MBQ9295688.1 tRNA-dihydrouridine synthase family protein [Paludibacteraceae bacterium]